MTSLDYVVGKYGKTKVIMSSKVDCRTLTFGTPREIKVEIDETLKVAKDCPGFVFAIGNHMPGNIPVDNALFYYDYLSQHWNR
jgi:uroporphyrinogen-III decarboxylase